MARAGRACMDAGSCNLTRTTAVGRQKNQRHTLREKRERESSYYRTSSPRPSCREKHRCPPFLVTGWNKPAHYYV